jgi:hypothetical protein
MRTEFIRHHFWHIEIDAKAIEHARKNGLAAILEHVPKRWEVSGMQERGVVRKHMGYGHPVRTRGGDRRILSGVFQSLPNFHRPCGVPEVVTKLQGQPEKDVSLVRDNVEILRQLPDLARYLKPDLTVEVMN